MKLSNNTIGRREIETGWDERREAVESSEFELMSEGDFVLRIMQGCPVLKSINVRYMHFGEVGEAWVKVYREGVSICVHYA